MFDKFFRRVQIPNPDKKLQIFTDGHSDYTTVLKEIYCETCLDYGQLIKVKKKGKLVAKQKWKIFGDPDWKDIETTDVENSNSIMRERNGRLVRKSKCFSKKKGALCYSIEFLQMYWNLMKPIHDKKTPALIEGLADTTWTWDDFFNYRLSTTD